MTGVMPRRRRPEYLVREMLLSSADLLPHPDTHRLQVHVHTRATPRSNEAVAKLCDTLTALELHYPGTDLAVVYEPPGVA